jgi:hypothetical protein
MARNALQASGMERRGQVLVVDDEVNTGAAVAVAVAVAVGDGLPMPPSVGPRARSRPTTIC